MDKPKNYKWSENFSPLIPIYYIGHKHLKTFLQKAKAANYREVISYHGLKLMLDFFEEFEEFENAALVRDALLDIEGEDVYLENELLSLVSVTSYKGILVTYKHK